MNKSTYRIISKFSCCGMDMVIVRIGKAACVMPEKEYNRIRKAERKFKKEK